MATSKSNFWSSPLTQSRITSDDVKMPEMLLGYFIGPFGALLSSGIFTSILQNYFTDVLKLDLGFLTTLQLISTVLIVADHGNADEMYEKKKNPTDAPKAKTSHTLNKVPFIIYNGDVTIKEGDFGLANVAATVVKLLGLEPDSHWLEAIIK